MYINLQVVCIIHAPKGGLLDTSLYVVFTSTQRVIFACNLYVNISAINVTVERYRPRTLRWLLDQNVELEAHDILANTPPLYFYQILTMLCPTC